MDLLDHSPTAAPERLVTEIKQLLLQASNLPNQTVETLNEMTPLFADGLGLDSIDVLELVVMLDKRFGLKVKNDDNGLLVFRNIRSIANAIHNK